MDCNVNRCNNFFSNRVLKKIRFLKHKSVFFCFPLFQTTSFFQFRYLNHLLVLN